jgi:predicted dehydrogenase
MSEVVKDIVAVVHENLKETKAPVVPYEPRQLKSYHPNIGLIACGGITAHHLQAYKDAGYKVVALCDLIEERAKARRKEYFPDAQITTDYRDILARKDIEVVDIATHPAERVQIIEDALNAGKHVLSQKPFVLDLATGKSLVQTAKNNNVSLAVNQNGRWAPHLGYIREVVRGGHVGDVQAIHVRIAWDHSWTRGTPFEQIEDLVLYDFAIHWFDFLVSLIPNREIKRVFASKTFAAGQDLKVPLLAQAVVEFDGGQASLVFDAGTLYGSQDVTNVVGTKGSVTSDGSNLGEQTVRFYNSEGVATPQLKGAWFPDGFHGTMAELLSSIEERRSPLNNASDNLRSLSLAFAAIASANEGRPYKLGEAVSLWTPSGRGK